MFFTVAFDIYKDSIFVDWLCRNTILNIQRQNTLLKSCVNLNIQKTLQ